MSGAILSGPEPKPDQDDIETALFRHLAQQGWCLSAPTPLAGGRSNHVWRAGDKVVKLYRSDAHNPLFANDPDRERAMLRALSGTGMAPRYVAHGLWQGQAWLMYTHVCGARWESDPSHVARILSIVHDQAKPRGLPFGCNGSEALAQQTRQIVAAASQGTTLLDRAPQGVVPPTSQLCLIHGDPVPGNIVAHNGTLALIDWQCPQLGDPAEDLALFLSPAMQLTYRGRVLSRQEEAEFVTAYPHPRVVARYYALKPWFHWRMAAYCAWRGETDARDLELAEI
ncbi:MAG: hypothetical protein EpisKO_39700 [Epibacterium sp.]